MDGFQEGCSISRLTWNPHPLSLVGFMNIIEGSGDQQDWYYISTYYLGICLSQPTFCFVLVYTISNPFGAGASKQRAYLHKWNSQSYTVEKFVTR